MIARSMVHTLGDFAFVGLRIAAGLLGATLLWATWLLYEEEEAGVQDFLSRWWIQLDGARPIVVGRHVRFIHGVATATTKCFRWLFGDATWSTKSVLGSFVVSNIGAALISSIRGTNPFLILVFVYQAGLLLMCAVFDQIVERKVAASARSRPRRAENQPTGRTTGGVPILVAFVVWPFIAKPGCEWFKLRTTNVKLVVDCALLGDLMKVVGISFLASALCAFCALTATRSLLASARRTTSAGRLCRVFLLATAVPAVAIALPRLLSERLASDQVTRTAFQWISDFNATATFALALCLAIAVGLLLHLALWPLLLRPLYALERFRPFFAHRGATTAFAVALLLAGVLGEAAPMWKYLGIN